MLRLFWPLSMTISARVPESSGLKGTFDIMKPLYNSFHPILPSAGP